MFDGKDDRPAAVHRASNREQLVLKPNDEYGGKGIVLGWEVDDAEWERGDRGGAGGTVHRAGAHRAAERGVSRLSSTAS